MGVLDMAITCIEVVASTYVTAGCLTIPVANIQPLQVLLWPQSKNRLSEGPIYTV